MDNTAEVHQLSIAFKGSHRIVSALDKISFSLFPGECLVLVGESGCGKSITSLALMRLLPKNGVYSRRSKMVLDGQDILNLPEKKMRGIRGRRMAMIFQEPMTALNPVMTVGEQIEEVLQDKQGVLDLLKEVELPEPEKMIHRYPHQLSGGQKQRVMIAMALACKPDILIADEPTTALDVTIQAQILALLKKLQKSYGMSLLLITHDLGVVKAMADRVCVMYAGQVVEQSLVTEFFAKVQHPYVQQLLASLPNYDKRQEKLSTITGVVPTLKNMPSGCRFHTRCIYAFDTCRTKQPELQRVNGRMVRCHLYPQIQDLPQLISNKIAWNATVHDAKEILTVRDLSVHYSEKRGWLRRAHGEVKAVDQLSFSLKQGKTLALVGESGCGKTSTGRALLRLLPIASGQIYYRDTDVLALAGRNLREYRKKIQIIFQDPFSSMNPRMTVAEIIAEGMHAQGFSRKHIKAKQTELLDQVGLPLLSLDRYPHQFSGGQRQRICIARALATDPDILICDEPTSALDVSVQAQILNLLKQVQQDRGISYLFITHNMAVVSYIADDVLVMKNGVAVEFGGCEQILKHAKNPYTVKLLGSVLDGS